jgi:hypothetical protein
MTFAEEISAQIIIIDTPHPQARLILEVGYRCILRETKKYLKKHIKVRHSSWFRKAEGYLDFKNKPCN